jgi:hypothetical protein
MLPNRGVGGLGWGGVGWGLYIYIYIYILRLRPCRRPPFDQQATDDWMTPEMGHFLYPKLLFWRPWCCILVSRVTILVVQGATGTPNRHLEVPLCISLDFRVHSGSLLGPTLAPFCRFSWIWGTKMGDSFQVHAFGDPGMEMMPEWSGCMCLIYSKNSGFWVIPLFTLIH